ncbi:MAG: response regulator transcription factor [Woeseiaceae bacterium]
MTDTIRTILADDHSLIRNGVRQMLAAIAAIEIVAEASNGIEAVSSVKRHQPDLLIVDIAMPHANGIEVIEEARRWSPSTRCIVLTGMTSIALLHQAIQVGVAGVFHKSGNVDELVHAIPKILAGETVHSTRLDAALRQYSRYASLSSRELEVLQCLARGETLKEIAAKLGISRNTADKHRSSVMRKLDVHSSTELVAMAYREGMLDPA